MGKKILLLGGTEEARELAEMLDEAGANFVVSLAGRTAASYPGPMRVGGFGGVDGLVDAIGTDGFEVLVDATHPFAAHMSVNAKRAAKLAKIPYYRLERRPWRRAKSDRWVDVDSLETAAERLDSGSTVFLAVGAGGLAPFLPRRDLKLIVRSIEAPNLGNRRDIVVIQQRGPFDIEDERALWDRYGFDALVTKNSGGESAGAKLVVARERRTLVYMVRRPGRQPWPSAHDAEKMMRKLRRHLR
ncbi:cobalt-precorrin-6A reductase [Acuticoccus sp. MNP-M23]|uniref:cobalt-precorrin-6A reductase n=1 Tax=Acuticoccus sp. MNP-M23 TaxID=3072793 RepID=UPI00281696C1|nr:cobalt-precorrin-6A reductase [Acuticoccus sp. MNP-M23]WMS43648.1 cobalt-precorrin-6A reductase [Acuticoccus sp. MNP-M23]